MTRSSERPRVFTWHIHGSYLYYLSQGPFEIFIPKGRPQEEGYIGRGTTFPFGPNVHEVPIDDVKEYSFDCILFQTKKNFRQDQFEILSEEQRLLPKIYVEHDPPQQVPTDTPHFVKNEDVTLVHVTHFNKLMWDNGRTPVRVIDHGITAAKEVTYSGKLEKGIVVINNLADRGRRLGLDIFLEVRKHVPLDLIGMDSEKIGGLGEILHPQLPDFISQYRFFFNPIRYTSLGLAVLEAMLVGVPVVGLATTEMTTVIQNGYSGILHTDVDYLIAQMKTLLENKPMAEQLGAEGKQIAKQRFNIARFVNDWKNVFDEVIHRRKQPKSISVMGEIVESL
jgi:glycosyltransferase involved in cell wall biosynthesis